MFYVPRSTLKIEYAFYVKENIERKTWNVERKEYIRNYSEFPKRNVFSAVEKSAAVIALHRLAATAALLSGDVHPPNSCPRQVLHRLAATAALLSEFCRRAIFLRRIHVR